MIKVGKCELGAKPRVAAIVDEFIQIDKLIQIRDAGADLFEMRIDCYKASMDEIEKYLESVRSVIGLPMIGTVRENEWTMKDRVTIFRAVMPFVDSIDLELGTSISDEVKTFAKGKTIIISEHDYQKTPSDAAMRDMVRRSVDQGADIVKIAVMANSSDDVKRLFHFTEECGFPIVSIAMGPFGTVSRVIAPLFGSLFTYGYIGKPVAPGQLSALTLIDEINRYFPDVN